MIEDVLVTVKETLELNLKGELEKQDGKYGDGIVLEDLTQIQIGDETINELGLPAAILRSEGGEYRHFLTTKKDIVHDITIGLIVTDTDEQVSQKRLWRTIRAIENCLEINLPADSGILEFIVQNVEYNVSLAGIDESNSVAKAGVLSANITERVDAYTANQV